MSNESKLITHYSLLIALQLRG